MATLYNAASLVDADIVVVMADDPSDTDIYDVADDKPARPPITPKPTIPSQALSYQRNPAPQPATTEAITNFHMPLWLIVGGVVIEIVVTWIRFGGAFAEAATQFGVEVIISTALVLVGMLIAARLRGIRLGPIGFAAFKICALSIAPAAAADLADLVLRFIPLGGLIDVIGEFVLYFALLGALFDLDESDTWYCLFVIFLVRLAVYFALLFVAAR